VYRFVICLKLSCNELKVDSYNCNRFYASLIVTTHTHSSHKKPIEDTKKKKESKFNTTKINKLQKIVRGKYQLKNSDH
jgi:hypothetical protein